MMHTLVCRILSVLAMGWASVAAGEIVFEDLGEPVRERQLSLELVTRGPDGAWVAWGKYGTSDKNALVGIHLDNGEVSWVDFTRFGRTHIEAIKGDDGNLYVYTGSPGRFLKYDVLTGVLTDLGVPTSPANYWLGSAVAPDGKFYVGTYPQACLVRCDPRTGKVENLGRLSEDERECYLLFPVASDDNVLYCPVGLHHRELWAVDGRTGVKKQILPKSFTEAQGNVRVWLGADGRVYMNMDKAVFLCRPDGVEICSSPPAAKKRDPLLAGDKIVGSVDAQGKLALRDVKTKKISLIETRYEGAPRSIYSVSCLHDGRIYGGTVFPAISFCYDTRSGQLTNLGELAANKIQVYDTLSHPAGLFICSYMPASVDFYDPSLPVKNPANPRHIVSVKGQERPVQLATGPDGMIYTGTFPSKGRLGGALVRVNPNDSSSRVWTGVIPNQSIAGVVSLPELGCLFCTSSVRGGSSAISTEKEACVFLWDCQRETVAARAQPIPGATHYGAAVRASNGLVYGVAGNKYYAFDPGKSKVVFTGELPVKNVHFPDLSDEPVGPQGLIYGLGDDAVFAIDPVDRSVRIVARDKSIRNAHGFFVAPDRSLYYGSESRLMRCRGI